MLRKQVYTKFTPSLMSMKLTFLVSAWHSLMFLIHAVLPSHASISGSLKDCTYQISGTDDNSYLRNSVHLS